MVPTQRDDALSVLPPPSKGKVELQHPRGFPRSESRGQRQNKEQPSLLPLLHTLHLQTEGGEAGQEVRHFIHLFFGTCHLEAGAEVI